ncbi:hypothetical protein OAJ65_01660 [Flavobacteriales bacterium]|nr:hypothetical protein [Flavobacteriales bacterium]
MKKLFKLTILLIFPLCAYGQINTFHTGEKILFSQNILNETTSYSYDTTQFIIIVPRIFGLSSISNNRTYNSYLLGVNLSANISNKFILIANYDKLEGNHNSLITDYLDSLGVYPVFGATKTRFQFNLKYNLNKFFTMDAGKGKHFIGNGYRSLLLSSEHSPYPYFKLATEFGRIRYYNLYTTFLNPNMVDYGRKKHVTIHYLDFAITQKIHIGLFESILWQSKSESRNNGYELAYLNPVIFYRPVEFSMGSNKGNALMGANFNAKFKKIILYGQFMIDDLNISRQEDRDDNYAGGFFQNKYAYQLGLKGKIKDVKYLIEYNQVQPYTYGHRTILQNYSHMNQALAHPLGANFKELINILEIKKGKWTYKIKTMFANVGLDSTATHYGQNIFASDYDASTGGQASYGNFNGQGVATKINTLYTEVAYSLKWGNVFGSVYYRTKKSDLLDQTFLFYSVGIRTFPFSAFTDY